MARHKAFSRQAALNKAIELFWTNGFEATTMTDLRKAMGIGRQSLYDTFGDKNHLFAEALGLYIKFNNGQVDTLIKNPDPIEGIRAFLETRVRVLSSKERRGCLMINSCVEMATRHSVLAAQVQEGLTTMHQGFEKALNLAVEQERIPPETDVTVLGHFFMNHVAGMVVMAKNQATQSQLQAVTDLAMQAIE